MAIVFYKWLLVALFSLPAETSSVTDNDPSLHPFYASVTEIEYNPNEKTLEIGCKVFTEDFEKTLNQAGTSKVDIYHPADSQQLAKRISEYISRHLQIKLDARSVLLEYVGYEIEEQSTWNFFQVKNVTPPKKIELVNNILYELFDRQMNIMHVSVAGNRKSIKLDYPATTASFEF